MHPSSPKSTLYSYGRGKHFHLHVFDGVPRRKVEPKDGQNTVLVFNLPLCSRGAEQTLLFDTCSSYSPLGFFLSSKLAWASFSVFRALHR